MLTGIMPLFLQVDTVPGTITAGMVVWVSAIVRTPVVDLVTAMEQITIVNSGLVGDMEHVVAVSIS